MDFSPSFYTNEPWSYFHPLPRSRNNRLPPSSRQRQRHIYDEGRPQRTNSNSTSTHSCIPSISSLSVCSGSGGAPTITDNHNHNHRRTHRQPQPPRPHSQPEAQALAMTSPFNLSDSSWFTHSPRSNKFPLTISFERAAYELSVAIDQALEYIEPILTNFKRETREVRRYADQATMDQIWAARIAAAPKPAAVTRNASDNDNNNYHDHNDHHGQRQDDRNGDRDRRKNNSNNRRNDADPPQLGMERERRLLTLQDHQIAVYNRCDDMLRAESPLERQRRSQNPYGRICHQSPPYVDFSFHSHDNTTAPDAQALLVKISRAREDLFPVLKGMGRRWGMAGTAMKEMKILKGSLETFQEVWDPDWSGEGVDGNEWQVQEG